MNKHTDSRKSEPAGADRFGTTHWSMVQAAAGSSPDSREALAALCRDYWYPLYAYVRRRTGDLHEAQDLIQEFFSRMLQKNTIAVANPQRGRFRTFLLASLRNFLTNEWNKAQAQKRGGGRAVIPFDFTSSESRYAAEPADQLTAEKLYDRQWAETLLDHVLARLRDEFVRAGKLPQFEQLKGFLAGGEKGGYAAAARRLGISEGAAMVAASRLRRRYRQLLQGEIAQTVAGPEEVQDEIRSLFASLGP